MKHQPVELMANEFHFLVLHSACLARLSMPFGTHDSSLGHIAGRPSRTKALSGQTTSRLPLPYPVPPLHTFPNVR